MTTAVPLRIAFMGTPDFAVPALRALHDAGHDIVAVYSQPPRPSGRGKQLHAGAVHQLAEELDIPVRTPLSLKDVAAQQEFAALQIDVAIVAAYGLILPKPVLQAPRMGCINIHASLLPRWRGAAPVQRAILAGDKDTGITIMQMEAGLDTGPMLARAAIPVASMNAGDLTEALAKLGARMIVDYLANPHDHAPQEQDDSAALYAPKIDKSEARLDFLTSAVQVERQIRAFTPSPGAFFEHDGERYRLLAAEVIIDGAPPARPGEVVDNRLTIQCNPGQIRPLLVQRAGRAAMTPEELLRGKAIAAGTRLR